MAVQQALVQPVSYRVVSLLLAERSAECAVLRHEFERDRDRRFKSMHHHADAVADQQEVTIFVRNCRSVGMIGS